MIRRPPRSTLSATLFPSTSLVRSVVLLDHVDELLDLVLVERGVELDRQVGCGRVPEERELVRGRFLVRINLPQNRGDPGDSPDVRHRVRRSEEHTSELQSLMRISYADFSLNKKRRQ